MLKAGTLSYIDVDSEYGWADVWRSGIDNTEDKHILGALQHGEPVLVIEPTPYVKVLCRLGVGYVEDICIFKRHFSDD